MKISRCPTYEIRLFLGAHRRDKTVVTEESLLSLLSTSGLSLRIVPTTFCSRKGDIEPGWEISTARLPKYQEVESPDKLVDEMLHLANVLRTEFDQDHVYVVTPTDTVCIS